MSRWPVWLRLHLRAFALILVVLVLARLAFVIAWAPAGLWHDARALAAAAFWGFRLDLRVAAIAVAPSFLIGWARFAWRGDGAPAWMRAWLAFVVWALALLAIVNHFYFQNFQTPIDPQLFQALEWETLRPVLQTILDEYPWPAALALAGALGFALARWFRVREGGSRWRFGRTSMAALAAAVLLFGAARGSLGTFPLTPNRIPSTGQPLLDAAVVNAPIALAAAWSDWRRDAGLPSVSEAAARAAWRRLHGGDAPEDLLAAMMRATRPAGDAPMPHVVFFQMESMGAGVMALDGVNGNDLLGRLRPHWRRDFLWPRAASAALGTHETVERMLLSAFSQHFSRGAHRREVMAGSPVQALKAAGWRTVFVTGGVKSWSRFDSTMRAQGFDEVVGQAEIMAEIPGAETDGTWGVYDEYLFAWVRKRLERAKRPLFIYAMTTTNHSPYRLPAHWRAPPLHVPEQWRQRMLRPELSQIALQSWRYAADQLGGFLDWLERASGIAERTIVAATGDHYMRDAMNYHLFPQDAARQFLVPVYLRLPAAYRQGVHYDAHAPAGHLDLFPTIFARLPVPVRYLETGRDLLAPEPSDAFALGAPGFAMDRRGCVIGGRGMRWKDGVGGDVLPAPDGGMDALAARANARLVLLRWATARRAAH